MRNFIGSQVQKGTMASRTQKADVDMEDRYLSANGND